VTEERLQHQSWSGRSAGADAFLMEHSKVGDSTLYPSKHGLYIFFGWTRRGISLNFFFKLLQTFFIGIDCFLPTISLPL
jgi:hypothetical protein